jgi:hypothetical protein
MAAYPSSDKARDDLDTDRKSADQLRSKCKRGADHDDLLQLKVLADNKALSGGLIGPPGGKL